MNYIGEVSNDVQAPTTTYEQYEGGMMHTTAKFLSESFRAITSDSPSARVIKAYILSKSRDFNHRQGIRKTVKTNCQYCFNPWTHGLFNLKLMPKKIPRKKSMRRIVLSDLSRSKNKGRELNGVLKCKMQNSKESNIHKKLKKLAASRVHKVMLTCLICKKDNIISEKRATKTATKNHNQKIFQSTKKIKKRKIDPFSGLNPHYCKNSEVALPKCPKTPEMNEANCAKESDEKNKGKKKKKEKNKEAVKKNVGTGVKNIGLLGKKCLEQSASDKRESGEEKNEGKKSKGINKVAIKKNVKKKGVLGKKCLKHPASNKKESNLLNFLRNF